MTSEFDSPLWARVEDALDERRDLFADARLVADLEAAPAALAAARRLSAALRVLPSGDAAGAARKQPSAARPVPALVPLVAAAAAIAVTAAAWRGAPAPVAAPAFDRLLVYEARVAVERPVPPAPLARRIVHPPGRAAAWTVSGATRR